MSWLGEILHSSTGSEHKSWLLFCAAPVLLGVLPGDFYNHLGLLIAAIFILLSDKISVGELTRAETYLKTSSSQNFMVSVCQ